MDDKENTPGPADGYAPGHWVNHILAGRGGFAQYRGNLNPRLIAVPEESVQDMGAIKR